MQNRTLLRLFNLSNLFPNPPIHGGKPPLKVKPSRGTVMVGLIDTQPSFSAWLRLRTVERAVSHIPALI